jgi:hypothetical protein
VRLRLYNSEDIEICENEVITSFRGDSWKFIAVTSGRKLYMEKVNAPHVGSRRELYVGVFPGHKVVFR